VEVATVATVLLVVLFLLAGIDPGEVGGGARAMREGPSRPVAAPRWRFVSTPDAWNNDIGDVRKASGWEPGEPNSINHSWRRATDTVLADIALREPRFVLVAGDLVQGRWDDDIDGVGTFGATTSLAARRDAVREGAGIYYAQWRAQFRRHGLRVHAAVGDHEIGDDDWTEEHERALVPTFKDAWSRAFTYRRNGARFLYPRHPADGTQHARTAYAFRSGPVFLVTVDVFHQWRDGSVHITIVGSQLRWLRHVVRAANSDPAVKFIVVQGHTPVLPARYAVGSSGLHVDRGASSPFWRTLERNGVDLYLCGEAHTISRANRGGVEQVVHGSNIGFSKFNYLTIAVSPQRLWLTLRVADVQHATDARMWQAGYVRPWASRRVGRFSVVGTMRVTADGREQQRRGMFRQGAPAPGGSIESAARRLMDVTPGEAPPVLRPGRRDGTRLRAPGRASRRGGKEGPAS
jgi:hypothetical protein